MPVISVDTKKKELIGNYENRGPAVAAGEVSRSTVNGHDFPDPSVPRAYPYGIYDLAATPGSSTWGPTTTPARSRWPPFGAGGASKDGGCIPRPRTLLITADGGGSNGYRLRLWKMELQKIGGRARDSRITVCHFPPGTSKWNKVEHRLFSFISSNWRGEPLRDYETIVRLIARHHHRKRPESHLPPGPPQISRRAERSLTKNIATINLTPQPFHGEWNYTIQPRRRKCVNVIY